MHLRYYSSPGRVKEFRDYSLSKRMPNNWIPLVDVMAEETLEACLLTVMWVQCLRVMPGQKAVTK